MKIKLRFASILGLPAVLLFTSCCGDSNSKVSGSIDSRVVPKQPGKEKGSTNPEFYAVDSRHGVRFDIFRFNAGAWQMESVLANIGDRIGGADPTPPATNFDTGWTLVDVREDPADSVENKIVILARDDGAISSGRS